MVNDLLGFRVNRCSVFSRREEGEKQRSLDSWSCKEARGCLFFEVQLLGWNNRTQQVPAGALCGGGGRGRAGLRAAGGHGEHGPAAPPCGHAGERHPGLPRCNAAAAPREPRVLLCLSRGTVGLLSYITGSGGFCLVITQQATPGLQIQSL